MRLVQQSGNHQRDGGSESGDNQRNADGGPFDEIVLHK
jgi:hypothetical protein